MHAREGRSDTTSHGKSSQPLRTHLLQRQGHVSGERLVPLQEALRGGRQGEPVQVHGARLGLHAAEEVTNLWFLFCFVCLVCEACWGGMIVVVVVVGVSSGGEWVDPSSPSTATANATHREEVPHDLVPERLRGGRQLQGARGLVERQGELRAAAELDGSQVVQVHVGLCEMTDMRGRVG